jgi:hypothetical protein
MDEELYDRILKRIPLEILGLSLLLALGALFLFDALTALFVFLGGLLAAGGFMWLKRSATRFLSPEKGRALRSSLLLYGLRLVLILAIFFIIILSFSERIYAFAAGFSTMIPVFLIEAIAALSSIKTWKH